LNQRHINLHTEHVSVYKNIFDSTTGSNLKNLSYKFPKDNLKPIDNQKIQTFFSFKKFST